MPWLLLFLMLNLLPTLNKVLFYSILFYSILFYSILFYSILFYSLGGLVGESLGWGLNQAYSRLSTSHGHITDSKLDSVVYAGVCVMI